MNRLGKNVIRPGQPLAMIEEVLVPVFLGHPYQVEAIVKSMGGHDRIVAFSWRVTLCRASRSGADGAAPSMTHNSVVHPHWGRSGTRLSRVSGGR